MPNETCSKKVGAKNFQVRPAAPPICQFGLCVFVHLVVSGFMVRQGDPSFSVASLPYWRYVPFRPVCFELGWDRPGCLGWLPHSAWDPWRGPEAIDGQMGVSKSPYCFFVR